MQTQTGTWLHAAKQRDKLNIITSPTHERYESNLSETNHNFYSLHHPKLKNWDEKYAKKPSNYQIFDINECPWGEGFDIVLAQHVFGQFQFLAPISNYSGMPIIRLEHTTSEHLDPNVVKESSKMFGNINVFIAKDQIKKWQLEDKNCVVIKHCVDEFFSSDISPSQRKKTVLSIANDFVNRNVPLNYTLWKKLIHNRDFTIVGDSKGLSVAAKDMDELRNFYRTSRVFLNTSRFSPIPSVLLEAAACGCAIVTTNTCAIPEYFTHGYNCLMSNDEAELNKYLDLLLSDDNLADELGKNAEKTMREICSKERFIKEWNEVFNSLRLG